MRNFILLCRGKRQKVKGKIRLFLFLALLFTFSFLFSLSAIAELPNQQAHALPVTLVQWQDKTNSGDYFSELKITPVGYLVWSKFPIKVYVEKPLSTNINAFDTKRFQVWLDKVLFSVDAWNKYLPLALVEQPEIADIKILRSRPELKVKFNRETREFNLPRARAAETRYEFYINKPANKQPILAHKFTIQISPDLSDEYIQAAAIHEIGHALGIWGHSPIETDVMYFSQVRQPPPISARDINTLKQVYQQPTSLGWPIKGEKRQGG